MSLPRSSNRTHKTTYGRVVYDRKPHVFGVKDVVRIIRKVDWDRAEGEEILTCAALLYTIYLKLVTLIFRRVGINLQIAWQLWSDFLNLFLVLRDEIKLYFGEYWEGMKKQLKVYIDS